MSITAPKGPHGALGRQIANDLGLDTTDEELEFAESSDDEDVYTVVLSVRARSQEEADRKCVEAMSRDEKDNFFWYRKFNLFFLSTLASNASCQLHIFGFNRDTAGMNRQKLRILEESD